MVEAAFDDGRPTKVVIEGQGRLFDRPEFLDADKILAVASGEKSKSELLGYGDNEFVPWQIGATF